MLACQSVFVFLNTWRRKLNVGTVAVVCLHGL